MNYIVFNTSGEILRTGICLRGDLHRQATKEGETVIEGVANDSLHRIIKGEVVDKPCGAGVMTMLVSSTISLSEDDQPVTITRKQWREVQEKLGIVGGEEK